MSVHPAMAADEGASARGEGRIGSGAWWIALFWATSLCLFAGSALYLHQPLPAVPGGRLAGAAARGALSASFWAAIGAGAFAAGVAMPRLSWAGPGVRCVAGSALTSLAFHFQGQVYCRQGWLDCNGMVAASLATLPMAVALGSSLALAGCAYARAARHREAETREQRLAAALAGARLDALGVQLRPHFLFNTLQSVATLLHRDAPAARRMLAGLSALLERSALAGGEQEVPLARELELLRLYTDIESVRFGERLRVEVAAEDGTESALVPHLLLQPLVENAIRHAVGKRGEGRIEVRAAAGARPGTMSIEVRDNGDGLLPGAETRTEGVGLANTRARLETLYGAAQSLALESRPGAGLTVRITLPLRRAA